MTDPVKTEQRRAETTSLDKSSVASPRGSGLNPLELGDLPSNARPKQADAPVRSPSETQRVAAAAEPPPVGVTSNLKSAGPATAVNQRLVLQATAQADARTKVAEIAVKSTVARNSARIVQQRVATTTQEVSSARIKQIVRVAPTKKAIEKPKVRGGTRKTKAAQGETILDKLVDMIAQFIKEIEQFILGGKSKNSAAQQRPAPQTKKRSTGLSVESEIDQGEEAVGHDVTHSGPSFAEGEEKTPSNIPSRLFENISEGPSSGSAGGDGENKKKVLTESPTLTPSTPSSAPSGSATSSSTISSPSSSSPASSSESLALFAEKLRKLRRG